MADLFAIFERIARRICRRRRRGAGGAPPPHPPVAAFENYIKGLLAETPATALNYLNAALRADRRVRPRAPGAVGSSSTIRANTSGRSPRCARSRQLGPGAPRPIPGGAVRS